MCVTRSDRDDHLVATVGLARGLQRRGCACRSAPRSRPTAAAAAALGLVDGTGRRERHAVAGTAAFAERQAVSQAVNWRSVDDLRRNGFLVREDRDGEIGG